MGEGGKDAEPITRQIEPELLQRLGYLVVNWSLVEHHVSSLFVFLTEGEPGSMLVVTENVSQSVIVGWIRALLDLRQIIPTAWESEVREVLREVDELRIERNALVHGLWSTSGPENSVIVQTVKLGRRGIVQSTVQTVADLDDLINHVLDVAARLSDLLRRTASFARVP